LIRLAEYQNPAPAAAPQCQHGKCQLRSHQRLLPVTVIHLPDFASRAEQTCQHGRWNPCITYRPHSPLNKPHPELAAFNSRSRRSPAARGRQTAILAVTRKSPQRSFRVWDRFMTGGEKPDMPRLPSHKRGGPSAIGVDYSHDDSFSGTIRAYPHAELRNPFGYPGIPRARQGKSNQPRKDIIVRNRQTTLSPRNACPKPGWYWRSSTGLLDTASTAGGCSAAVVN
jgi:hypothetical protein